MKIYELAMDWNIYVKVSDETAERSLEGQVRLILYVCDFIQSKKKKKLT